MVRAISVIRASNKNKYFQFCNRNPIAEDSNLIDNEANLYLMNPWHVMMTLVDLAEEKKDSVDKFMEKLKETDAKQEPNLLLPTNARVFGFAPKRRFFY